MFRKTFWKFKMRNRYRNGFFKNIVGGLLVLIGVGIILATLPGWFYLTLLGSGFLFVGIMLLRT